MPETRGLVLVVEDEPHIADLQRRYLTREGFGVHTESDGAAGLAAARRLHPAAIVLDIGLPGLDGISFCRALREADDWTPVLLVTARDEEADRILGLELGADDYLTKPFSPRELVARVKTVLRRAAGPPGEPVLTLGRLVLDPQRRTVLRDGAPVELTGTEFNLLARLMRHPGRIFTREQLMSQVWGYAGYRDGRVVDVCVSQLRAKLGDASPIRTVRGVGYGATDRPA
ncbi:response regulator transcription factor [Kitasatospora paracochleata]|uniref:DNA-binding response OmpR family regulator n=1 Tax=Kitasatospora paracochleata TaxID=58354 RepID=A0ABT1IVF1_9ACTN|nr:response regulator transcription factor [Kitasatospora paracochleata]MCP2309105.1 DNA-binding response OmpR family regulator [Kitasatospora paracochleata]